MAYCEKEERITCPFDPAHQILRHRMPQHIIKCRRNHPEMDMKTCHFNATHVVPSVDYEAHISVCPSKANVERDIYRSQEVDDAMKIKSGWNTMPSNSLSEENWDEESGGGPYNPMETMIKKEFARPPPPGTLGKGAKKKWRKAEIERVRLLIEENEKVRLHEEDIARVQHLEEERLNGGPVYSAPSLTSGTSYLAGGTSLHDSTLEERDAHEYSSTARKCNQLLQRQEASLQNASRSTADIFNNNHYDDSQACEDTGAVQEMYAGTGTIQKTKAALKNKKRREVAKNKRAKTMQDSHSNTEKIQGYWGPVDTGTAQNMPEYVDAAQNMPEYDGAAQNMPEYDGAVHKMPEYDGAAQNMPKYDGPTLNMSECEGATMNTPEDVQNISKAALKNKRRCEAARKKRALSNSEMIQVNSSVYPSHPHVVANVKLTGNPEEDRVIKKFAKKLDEIHKIKLQEKEGKCLEKNQIDKIAMESQLLFDIDQLFW